MQVAVAYAAGDGFDQDFAILGFVEFNVLDTERHLGPVENSGFHPECSLSVSIISAAHASNASTRAPLAITFTTTLREHFQRLREFSRSAVRIYGNNAGRAVLVDGTPST